MPQGNPKSGEQYRHFKNKLYQIVTVARHSETGEELVIYQALYGEFRVYARPLSMFVSEVERDKYPDVTQRYRFELVEQYRESEEVHAGAEIEVSGADRAAEISETMQRGKLAESPAAEKDTTGLLMDFYDAPTYDEKYNILTAMRDGITDVMIDNMAVVLDVVIPEGEPDKRYEELKRCLKTHRKFETTRA